MKFKPLLILIPITLLALLPYLIMVLWNRLVTDIFHLRAIHYWEALGLFILGRILFGNFGFNKHGHKPSGHFKKHFMNMSDEERSRFRAEWKRRKDC
ncbi:MAG: hypothetical protein JNM95_09290 [Chitinophagaceae bacterium]|nr:hypothetical protein [Chitinophagaceae bacterium]